MRRFCVSVGSVLLAVALCAAQEGGRDSSQPAGSTRPAPPAQQTTPPELKVPDSSAVPPAETQPNSTPDAPSHTKTKEELEKEKVEQSYRVMGIVPMFGTTSRHNAKPLTPGEKFHLFARSTFDPVTFAVVGFQAGISQAQDSFESYGQGAEGYAKRYGAAFADSVDSSFFSNFFYPVLFKQDPRYFRLGEGTIKHRIVYSVEQEFVAHKDSGGRTFHYSNVLGALTAGSISNAYYPQEDRGFGLTMSRAGIALLYGSLGGAFSEFWPDIQRKVFKNKQKPGLVLPDETPSPTPPSPLTP